jgi:hypothetical protein
LKPKKETSEILFYQKLGELFYAIAAADKHVNTKEYSALIKMIIDDWKIYESVHDFYTEADGFQIEYIFNLLYLKKVESQICFNHFKDYARTNAFLFPLKKVKLIFKTATAIANSFSSKNKKELIMLANLKLLFQEQIFNKQV